MPRSPRASFASLASLLALVASGNAAACGPSAVKAPVGPPPEYEEGRPPVPASATAPAATPTSSASPPP